MHENIRKLRDIKGFSQEYMATKLNISQNTYSRIENGYISLKFDRLIQIASILEIDIPKLINFNDQSFFNVKYPENSGPQIEIIKTYKNYIQHLEDEIKFLRSLLKTKKEIK